MKIEKLFVNSEFKNYKQLCSFLEVPIKSGSSKVAQLNELKRFCSYKKQKQSFIITEVYDNPLPKKQINRMKPYKGKGSILKTHPEKVELIIDTYGRDINTIGSGTEHTVRWKCQQCDNCFDYSVSRMLLSKSVKCEFCAQSKGSKKVYKLLDIFNINFQTEYTFEDLRSSKNNNYKLRFDYAIFNKSKLIGLIEYDGGYHDTVENIIKNDIVKNEYCKENNIPLLRIYYKNYKDIELNVIKFLKKIRIIDDATTTDYIENLINEITKKENEINSIIKLLNDLK